MKKTIIFIMLATALIAYGGTGNGHKVTSSSEYTLAFQDTLTLNATGDSDTLDYNLHLGRSGGFANGFITVWAYPDTGAVGLATATATDSLYCLYYPGNNKGWRGKADTLRFESMTAKGPGLDWTVDTWYQANLRVPRCEKLRLLLNKVTKEAADADTVSIIVRVEVGLEK